MKLNEHYQITKKTMFELRDMQKKVAEANRKIQSLEAKLHNAQAQYDTLKRISFNRGVLLDGVREKLIDALEHRTGHKKALKEILDYLENRGN